MEAGRGRELLAPPHGSCSERFFNYVESSIQNGHVALMTSYNVSRHLGSVIFFLFISGK